MNFFNFIQLMKQTKSFQNIKNKKKGNNKNLELFNALSLRLRDFESANTKTSGFSSSTKNIINNHIKSNNLINHEKLNTNSNLDINKNSNANIIGNYFKLINNNYFNK